ncbi:MAG: HAD family phosphatase, partial [Pseudomonadota bacterium]
MIRPELVIFDCDGVLVDSEPITNQMLQEDLAGRGLDLTLQEILHMFVGGTIAGVAKTAREMGAEMPDTWVPEFYERMYRRLAEGTPLINGVEALMDRLDAAGIPYAVGSNGSERKM